MAGNRWIESIRWIIFAVDSFFQSHPRMALAIRITLFCLVYILVGHIQLFFYGGEAVDQQVRAPANYLPRLFHDKSSVIDLHDGNLNAMNRIIANNHLTVVLFYARWCPFSQRLARRYEKLASLLKDEVAMVAIDCWLSDGECRKSTISITYPVLIAHMLDQQILYHGGWREDEILAFVKRLLHPLQHLSSKEAYSTALLNHNVFCTSVSKKHSFSRNILETAINLYYAYQMVMFVGSFEFSNSYWPRGFVEYYKAAVLALHRDPLRDPPFVVITDKTLALELGLSHAPSITAVSYHRGNQLYTSSMFSEGISNWSRSITEEQVYVEYFNPLIRRNAGFINKPALFLFLPLNYSQSFPHIKEFHVAAEMHSRQVSLARRPCLNLNHLVHQTCSHNLPSSLLQCPSLTTSSSDHMHSSNFNPFKLFRRWDVSMLNHYDPVFPKLNLYNWLNATPYFVPHPLRVCQSLFVSFNYIDSLRYQSVLQSMGYRDNNPHSMTLALLDFRNELQFVQNVSASTFSSVDVFRFIDDVALGKVPPLLRTSPPPSDPCLRSGSASSGCIIEVTTHTFQQIVMDTTKDVLLVYYAPWCAACSAIWPALFGVAEMVNSQPTLIIARVDGDANDLPPCHKAQAYPAIVLYPAHRKSRPVHLETSGEVDSNLILRFLQRHSSFPIPPEIWNQDHVDGYTHDHSDWSHEGWLLWIQSQKRIRELEEGSRNLSEELKLIRHELSQLHREQRDLQRPTGDEENKMYLKLQELVIDNFKSLLGDIIYQDSSLAQGGLHNVQNKTCDLTGEKGGKDVACKEQTQTLHSEGQTSHSEGQTSYSEGQTSHSQGQTSHNEGQTSHNEGQTLHSEGQILHSKKQTLHSKEQTSHSEGQTLHSQGQTSHSEGQTLHSEGQILHSKKQTLHSKGQTSHSQEQTSHSKGQTSHSERQILHSEEQTLHSKGQSQTSHSKEQSQTSHSGGQTSHIEGQSQTSHSKGQSQTSHGEGQTSNSEGQSQTSHSKGQSQTSHSEGQTSHGEGQTSHGEGQTSDSEGQSQTSHSGGQTSHSKGQASNSEGQSQTSHSKGQSQTSHSGGQTSHSEGQTSDSEEQSQTSQSKGQSQTSHSGGQTSHSEGQTSDSEEQTSDSEGQTSDSEEQSQTSHSKGQSQTSHSGGQTSDSEGQTSDSEEQTSDSEKQTSHSQEKKEVLSGVLTGDDADLVLKVAQHAYDENKEDLGEGGEEQDDVSNVFRMEDDAGLTLEGPSLRKKKHSHEPLPTDDTDHESPS